ncbi:MAG: hypothetical protein FWF59_14430 [Turicibacter sp.]|nr:hypothetical protein [Turicibacter sp.]
MPCLSCHEPIEISGFFMVFSLTDPLLCGRCQKHLKTGVGTRIFEDNEWMRQQLHRLELGDVALLPIFQPILKKRLSGHFKKGEVVAGSQSEWLNFLIEMLQDKSGMPKVSLCIEGEGGDFSIV